MDVDPMARSEDPELVGQADVHVAIGGLGELGQLCCLSRAEVPDAVAPLEVGTLVELEDVPVELRRALGGPRRQGADQLRVPAKICEDPPGQHALRRKDQVEIDAFPESGPLLEHGLPPGAGCLLYTSDAADDLLCVDLGGRRIIKKK